MKKNVGMALRLRITMLLLSFSLLLTDSAFSQDPSGPARTPIKGLVTDENNAPLPGVSIIEKGTSNGTVSQSKGEFSISVRAQAILIFSMTGYKSQEVAVGINPSLLVKMNLLPNDLNEAVVIGYGTSKKKDLTGSVATISSKDLEERVVINPLDALEGKVAGLSISNNTGAPGGTFNVLIRGFGSITASSSALFVIDGIVGADIETINPNDIESVDVLKDASSTAIYGSRGANGVVIVTTKKPKNGDFQLSYNTSGSVSRIARKIDMIDSKGWLQMFNRSWEYDPARGPVPNLSTAYPDLFNSDGSPIYNTNWQEAATRDALSDRNNISLTQATEKGKQGLYLGYQNENGIMLNSYAKKFNARFTSEFNLRTWLTVGGSVSYNNANQNRAAEYGLGGENATRQLIEFLPIFPIKFPNGNYSTLEDFGFGFNPDTTYYKTGIYGASNPVQILNNLQNIVIDDQVLTSFYATIKLAKGLEFRSTYSAQHFSEKINTYVDATVLDLGSPSNGFGEVANSRNVYWQTENYLTYNKLFKGDHRFNAVLGTSFYNTSEQDVNASATEFNTDFYQYNNLGAGAVFGQPYSNAFAYTLNSYYTRLNYAYNSKYLLTLTGRYDGASKFGVDNKYAFFPSGALGWIASDENFLKDNKSISFLKFRASYGITGNSEISPYSSLGTISNYNITLNGQNVVGSAQGNAPNPNLKWEQTAQSDGGLELRLFKDRIAFSGDYYYKKTTNLLLNNPISTVTGFSSVTTNIGSLQNKGVELALNAKIIQEKDIDWGIGFTYAANRNKILALGSTNADIYPGPNFQGQTNILRVGQAVGSIWGLKRLGTWGTAEAAQAAVYGDLPGDIKRLDVNKDGVIDNSDAMILGNIFPKYDMTVTTNFRYKNWELSADVQVRHGNKDLNLDVYTVEDRQWYASGYASVLKDAWTPEHQNTMVPALRFNGDHKFSDAPGYIDSRWVEDGSFVRAKSVNLSYSLNQRATQNLGLKGLRFYANAQNLFVISGYRGSDPEVSAIGGGSFSQGMEFFGYPKAHTYTFGINANF